MIQRLVKQQTFYCSLLEAYEENTVKVTLFPSQETEQSMQNVENPNESVTQRATSPQGMGPVKVQRGLAMTGGVLCDQIREI